jgi:hypothetical protein
MEAGGPGSFCLEGTTHFKERGFIPTRFVHKDLSDGASGPEIVKCGRQPLNFPVSISVGSSKPQRPVHP